MDFTLFLLALALLCLIRVRKPLVIELEHNNITIRGKKLMAEIDLTQKIKLTAVPDGAVDEATFEAHIADQGTSVSLTPVEGELAVYANAVEVGQAVIGFSVVNTKGELLGALVQIDVKPVAATTIDIVEGVPEPL